MSKTGTVRGILLASVLLAALTVAGQTGFEPSLYRLYDRTSRSDFVVTGRVLEKKWLSEGPLQIGERVYGIPPTMEIVTFATSQIICRQGDFAAQARESAPPSGTVYLVSPFHQSEESDLDPGRWVPTETLGRGREYLLFLYRHPDQQALVARYKLSPDLTYYRAFDGASGAIELAGDRERGSLTDLATPVVSAVTSLCEAVRPTDVTAKLERLRELRGSADPRVLKSIDAAIRALKKEEDQKQK